MNTADMLELEKIGITELLAHTDLWVGLPDPAPRQDGLEPADSGPLGRLERLGLVTRSPHAACDGFSLTSAGVEALAYLAASR